MRIGFGYDAHRFSSERPLVLGGVLIPDTPGLLGHSDADVLTHAVIDGILGALALGTIGEHFPDTDHSYRDICSMRLLEKTVEMIRDKGKICNIDCVIVTEIPKLSPWLSKIRESLSAALMISVDQVSVKPKRDEGMGFTGRKEGIRAYASVLIEETGGKR